MKIAWLFPGQGAQAVGMGKDVVAESAAARAVFEQADAALDESVSTLCFDGPAAELTLTANTQPAIVATSAALLAALRERYPNLPTPDCAAGHSLGEYSALHAAGVLSVKDAVTVCRARGLAMQKAVPPGDGAMAAIMGLAGDAVELLCRELRDQPEGGIVSAANYNAPTQTVIAGEAGAVARASERAKERGGKAIPLKVSAPFHCALMAPARAPLSEALAQVALAAPKFAVIANVDAEPRAAPDAIRQALLQQVDSPVRWIQTLAAMGARGVSHALEIGPGRVLAGLAKRSGTNMQVLSVGSLAALDKVRDFLEL